MFIQLMDQMRKILPLFTVILTFILIDACKHTIPVPGEFGSENPSESDNCSSDTVYFVNDILPLISSNCAYSGCHDAGTAQDGVILDSYLNIINTADVRAGRPSNSDLYEVLLESGEDRMPPPPNDALTAEEIAMIRKWIEQGAKNNKCNECDTTVVTYSSTITAVLDKNCTSCHNYSTQNGGVNLDNYSSVKTLVDNDLLMGVIRHESGYKKMPPSGVKIPDCGIDQLEKWINEGAQNN